jgi:fumarate hydratase subunit alpha
MRQIDSQVLSDAVYGLVLEASFDLPAGVSAMLEAAAERETGAARVVLKTIIENAHIAAETRTAICQDCGLVVIFAEIGRDCHLTGDLYAALDDGVARAYQDGYLRKSSLADPLKRDSNTGDNLPAIVHVTIVAGDRITLHVAPKGGGSENMSTVDMLVPTAGRQGVIDRIVEQVVFAGGKPCPPLIIGVGLGGTMEKAALLSKWALMREAGEASPEPDVAKLENDILEAVNGTGVGPMGLGGRTTALAVHVERHACHIASLPLAINLQCHAARHKSGII